MAVYLIGAIEIRDEVEYHKYRTGAAAALSHYEGVELLSVDDHPEVLEGTQPANHLLVIKFVSSEQLHEFHGSPAYQAVIGHRHAAAETRFLMAMRGRD